MSTTILLGYASIIMWVVLAVLCRTSSGNVQSHECISAYVSESHMVGLVFLRTVVFLRVTDSIRLTNGSLVDIGVPQVVGKVPTIFPIEESISSNCTGKCCQELRPPIPAMP